MSDEAKTPASIGVSPKYTAAHLADDSIESKIDVFEDQIRGWVLQQAATLLSDKQPTRDHAGIAVLMLLLPYFEQIACFIEGASSKNKSREFFGIGIVAVFPRFRDELRSDAQEPRLKDPDAAHEKIVDVLYSEARCGLFHEGMIRGQILVARPDAQSGGASPFGVMIDADGDVGSIVFFPRGLLNSIAAHLDRYVDRLRDPKETTVRERFAAFWKDRVPTKPIVLPPT